MASKTYRLTINRLEKRVIEEAVEDLVCYHGGKYNFHFAVRGREQDFVTRNSQLFGYVREAVTGYRAMTPEAKEAKKEWDARSKDLERLMGGERLHMRITGAEKKGLELFLMSVDDCCPFCFTKRGSDWVIVVDEYQDEIWMKACSWIAGYRAARRNGKQG